MTKNWLAATAALIMMAGPAIAQVPAQDPGTAPAPAVSSYSQSTEKSTDANGVQTEKRSTYQAGPSGTTESSSSTVTAPVAPPPPTYQSTTTTTQTTTNAPQ